METKDVLLDLRTKKGLSQEELAEKLLKKRPGASDCVGVFACPFVST